MVSVCEYSKKVLKQSKKVKEISMRRKNKVLVKNLWRPCDKIKVRFGDNNFLHELTPLRCVDFSFDMTVQFWLFFK